MCVEKDVARTDRTHMFFHGDSNPNLTVLYDILLTHCMYNFDLGMPTALSPPAPLSVSLSLSVCLSLSFSLSPLN